MVATVLMRLGSWGLIAFAALFGLFAAGYAFEDPGGWAAVAMVAAFVVPVVTLALAVRRWPQRATVIVVPFVLVIVLAGVALPLLPDPVGGWLDRVGPVLAIATTVAAVALAILGLHRPGLAGGLLIAMAVFVFIQLIVSLNALTEGPGPRGVIGTSGGVMLVPMLIAGTLLLLGDQLERHEHRGTADLRGGPLHA